MELGEFIRAVAANYDRTEGVGSPTISMLKQADQLLEEHTPGGFIVRGSIGAANAPIVPWLAFLDPDETDSPTFGIYVVYLFRADLETVSLSLNQGCTQLRAKLKDAGTREQLASEARRLRGALPEDKIADLETEISLGSRAANPRFYEVGNIVARTYRVDRLPGEEELKTDLQRFIKLYGDAVTLKRSLLQEAPGTFVLPSALRRTAGSDAPLRGFKPKDSGEYLQHLQGRQLAKSRRHEALVNSYAAWAERVGFEVHSPHPQDLVLVRGTESWVIEAKVVRNENATEAVRGAAGQLLDYRHFLYREAGAKEPDGLVALFTEEIGEGYVEFLRSVPIMSVWRVGGRFEGSDDAVHAGLAIRPLTEAAGQR